MDASTDRLRQIRELGLKHSLVFLPNHRSYLDPLVLRRVLSKHGFPPNHVLGGMNLAKWRVGARQEGWAHLHPA